MKVCKFGGSSVANANQFRKVKAIVQSDPERKIVITSAAGKEQKSDNKMTDLLYLIHAHLEYSVSYESLFEMVSSKLIGIRDELGLSIQIEEKLDALKKELKKGISKDYLVSRGEYLTALLLADYLGYPFVDASEVMCFHYNGNIDMANTERALLAKMNEHPRMVIPGFYGCMPDGQIRVMTRGGSDITGSVAARIANADVYENWTDVSGILMADPRIIDHPKWIDVVTYAELRELSYMGANVLHEDAILPVKEVNIPIIIKNTNAPEDSGTMIVDVVEHDEKKNLITGISGKTDFTSYTMYRQNSSSQVGILKSALEVFEKYQISVEHVPTGIDNFSIVVSSSAIERCKYEIASNLKIACQCDSLKIAENISLIAIVGRNMASQCGAGGRLFNTLGQHGINIRMISQGSDEISIFVGVENKDFKKAIRVIYDEFC